MAAQGVACAWATAAPEYVEYHDLEWGRPVRADDDLYERLCLEAFQSGLSWLTILRKRAGFRSAFSGFDPVRVAAYGPDDVARLMADTGIVRNRAKIDAAIVNARAALELDGGLSALIWRFADPAAPVPKVMSDVPAQTAGSAALAKELKKNGFRFVGPTTAYALMQACGLVNDHLLSCPARPFGGPDLIVQA
ncbi:DNA-3-methyladenine glycosylase I [Actinocorallia lasiicapitis]